MFSVYKQKYSPVNDDEEETKANKRGSLYFFKWPYGSAVGLSLLFTSIWEVFLDLVSGEENRLEGKSALHLNVRNIRF
jgi:hypothetical protein